MASDVALSLGPDAVAALGRYAATLSGAPLSLALGASGLEVRTRARGVPVALTIALSALDGSVEVDVVRATAAGLGLFGTVRRMANAALVAQAAGWPVSLIPNERGNLTLSVPGIAFGAASADDAALTLSFYTHAPHPAHSPYPLGAAGLDGSLPRVGALGAGDARRS